MSKPLAYLITFVVCILLQVGVAPAIAIVGCSPNFLLIPVLLVAMKSGYSVGSLAGFCCGLFGDLAGDGPIGCLALTFTILAVIVGVLYQGLDLNSPLFTCVIVVCACLFTELVYGLAVVLSNMESTGVVSVLAGHALPSALYSAVIGCLALTAINAVVPDEAASMGNLDRRMGGRPNKMPRMQSRLK